MDHQPLDSRRGLAEGIPASLAGCYLRFCADNLRQLETYIERADLASVSQIARIFWGNAKRVGLSELSSLGRQLEEYCLGADWSAVGSTYREIVATVAKLCESKPERVTIETCQNGNGRGVKVRRVG